MDNAVRHKFARFLAFLLGAAIVVAANLAAEWVTRARWLPAPFEDGIFFVQRNGVELSLLDDRLVHAGEPALAVGEALPESARNAFESETMRDPVGDAEPSSSLLWVPVPGRSPYNRDGIIGRTIDDARGAGRAVLVLGDSNGVYAGGESWPFVLEGLLNDERGATGAGQAAGQAVGEAVGKAGKTVVLNAAVPGYTLYQGVQRLRRIPRDVRLDWVIAEFGWNDVFRTPNPPDTELGRLLHGVGAGVGGGRDGVGVSGGWLDWVRSVALVRVARGFYHNVGWGLRERSLTQRVPEADARVLIDALQGEAAVRGARLMVLTRVMFAPKGALHRVLLEDTAARNDLLREVAKGGGKFVLVDAARLLGDGEAHEVRYADECHLSATGARVLAGHVAGVIAGAGVASP